MTTAASSSTQRVHYPIGRTPEIIWSVVVLALLGYVSFDLINRVWTGQTSDIWMKVVLLLVLMITLASRMLVLSKKLILRPEALCCHHLDFQLTTPWSNLDQLYFVNHAGRSVGVLRLHQPAPVKRRRFALVREGSLIAIPLLDYDYSPGSPLRKDLERYAPHLFRSPSAN